MTSCASTVGCRFLNVCNGNLRTRAEAATGDWLAMDPSCYLSGETIDGAAASVHRTAADQ